MALVQEETPEDEPAEDTQRLKALQIPHSTSKVSQQDSRLAPIGPDSYKFRIKLQVPNRYTTFFPLAGSEEPSKEEEDGGTVCCALRPAVFAFLSRN